MKQRSDIDININNNQNSHVKFVLHFAAAAVAAAWAKAIQHVWLIHEIKKENARGISGYGNCVRTVIQMNV